MAVKVILVDVNPKMVAAWRDVFEDNPEVSVVQGSMLDQSASAWVTPTNARGAMEGGLDGAIRAHLGAQVQTRVQQAIATLHRGALPVGCATCVDTGRATPRFLISTPTVGASAQGVSETLSVALACAAAFQAVAMQNRLAPGSIASVALPGLGANLGKVPVEICADLMWTAYNLLRDNDFVDFNAMRAALEAELGALGNDLSVAPVATPAPPPVAPVTPTPRRPGVLGPVVPVGPFIPQRGARPATAPVPQAPVRPMPPPPPAPPVASAPRQIADFDDSE